MNITIYHPTPFLKPIISYYQVVEFDNSNPDMICSLPVGSCTLTIMLNDFIPHFESSNLGKFVPGNAFLCGCLFKSIHLKNTGKVRCLMILFSPLGAHKIFKIPQKQLVNRFVSLEEIIGNRASNLRNWLAESPNHYQIIRRFETFISDLLVTSAEPNDVCTHATEIIQNNDGNLKIDTLLNSLNISSRKLDRVFDQHIGVSPKQFAWMTRLRTAYLMLMQHPEYSIFDIFVKLGYYDQAHFINDIKKYADFTPQMLRDKAKSLLISKFN